jgi:hypothetical protein
MSLLINGFRRESCISILSRWKASIIDDNNFSYESRIFRRISDRLSE